MKFVLQTQVYAHRPENVYKEVFRSLFLAHGSSECRLPSATRLWKFIEARKFTEAWTFKNSSIEFVESLTIFDVRRVEIFFIYCVVPVESTTCFKSKKKSTNKSGDSETTVYVTPVLFYLFLIFYSFEIEPDPVMYASKLGTTAVIVQAD